MAIRERTTPAMEDGLNAAQVEFSLNPRFMAPQTQHILQAQEQLLNEAQTFWSAWFQRRQDATQSLIDAGRRIASGGRTDLTSVMEETADWQVHSMERLSEDARDCTEMLRRCAAALVANGATTAEEISGTAERTTEDSTSKSR